MSLLPILQFNMVSSRIFKFLVEGCNLVMLLLFSLQTNSSLTSSWFHPLRCSNIAKSARALRSTPYLPHACENLQLLQVYDSDHYPPVMTPLNMRGLRDAIIELIADTES